MISAHPTPDHKLLHVLYVNPELTAINAQIRYLNDWDIVATCSLVLRLMEVQSSPPVCAAAEINGSKVSF